MQPMDAPLGASPLNPHSQFDLDCGKMESTLKSAVVARRTLTKEEKKEVKALYEESRKFKEVSEKLLVKYPLLKEQFEKAAKSKKYSISGFTNVFKKGPPKS